MRTIDTVEIMKARLSLVGVLLLAVAPAVHGGLVTGLRVHVPTFATRAIDKNTPTRVVFLEDRVRVELSLVVAQSPGTTIANHGLAVRPTWWEDVTLTVTNAAGESFAPKLKLLAGKSADSGLVRVGETLTATFEVVDLRPGAYRLAAALNDVPSLNTEWFLVATGMESEALRREYARFQVDRSKSREELRRNLLRLAQVDALNASTWMRLGDLSLLEGAYNDADKHYAAAIEVLDRRAEILDRDKAGAVAGVRVHQKTLEQIRALLAERARRPKDLQVRIDMNARKRYLLVQRNGSILRAVE